MPHDVRPPLALPAPGHAEGLNRGLNTGLREGLSAGQEMARLRAALRPLSARQEKFCAAFVERGNGTRAALKAGYARRSAHVRACRLLQKDNIRTRIAALRADLGIGNRVEPATLLAKLERTYYQAVREGLSSAAVRAVEAQARIAGLLPDGRRRGG